MQTAFAMFCRLPPPAARARIFARRDGARAWRAADAGIAAIMERVVRYRMLADVTPDVLVGPVGQRIEFLQAVLRVPFLNCQVAASHRLGATLAGDPRVLAGERASQRLDLAQ